MEYIKKLIREFNNYNIEISGNLINYYRYKFYDKITGRYCFSFEFKEQKTIKELKKIYIKSYLLECNF